MIELPFHEWGARPNMKDLFVEYDWVTGSEPTREAVQKVKEAFLAAPGYASSESAYGSEGLETWVIPGIQLHVDTGSLSDPTASEGGDGPGSCGDGVDNDGDGMTDGQDGECLVGDDLGSGNAIPLSEPLDGGLGKGARFWELREQHFGSDRWGYFRYGISATSNDDSGGMGLITGHFVLFRKDGAALMHELGHTLNQGHGGADTLNCKPNYVSVMNPQWTGPSGIQLSDGTFVLDYSPVRLPNGSRAAAPLRELDEADLDETWPLDQTIPVSNVGYQVAFTNGNGLLVQRAAHEPIDWDGNGAATNPSVQVNIDDADLQGWPGLCANDKSDSRLAGWNDWATISLRFATWGQQFEFVDDPGDSAEPCPTLAESNAVHEALNTTDLSLHVEPVTSKAVAGARMHYLAGIENRGPNPAFDVTFSIALPSESVSFVTGGSACEARGGQVQCRLGHLSAGERIELGLELAIASDAAQGGATSITPVFYVAHEAGPDADPKNNLASVASPLIAQHALEITSFQAEAGITLQVGTSATLLLRAAVENRGPSGPVDAEFLVTAGPAAGLSLAPGAVILPVYALAVGEVRSYQAPLTVSCLAEGKFKLTLDAVLELSAESTGSRDQTMTGTVVRCLAGRGTRSLLRH